MRRALAALVATAVLAGAARAAPMPQVAVTIQPIAMLVRELAGDRVAVMSLVPPGASAHNFAAKPRAVAALEDAQVFVEVGAGLDTWSAQLYAAAAHKPRRLVLIELPGLDPLPADPSAGGREANGARARFDPHVWLDPIRVRDVIVPALAEELSRIDPDGRASFEANRAALQARIGDADAEIRRTLAGHGRKFVAFHGAWRYFAARYGLEEVAVVEEAAGEEPTPGAIAKLVAAARAADVPAILVEPQQSPRVAEAIAAELGIGTVVVDDENADPSDPQRSTYASLMLWNARAFARALGGNAS